MKDCYDACLKDGCHINLIPASSWQYSEAVVTVVPGTPNITDPSFMRIILANIEQPFYEPVGISQGIVVLGEAFVNRTFSHHVPFRVTIILFKSYLFFFGFYSN